MMSNLISRVIFIIILIGTIVLAGPAIFNSKVKAYQQCTSCPNGSTGAIFAFGNYCVPNSAAGSFTSGGKAYYCPKRNDLGTYQGNNGTNCIYNNGNAAAIAITQTAQTVASICDDPKLGNPSSQCKSQTVLCYCYKPGEYYTNLGTTSDRCDPSGTGKWLGSPTAPPSNPACKPNGKCESGETPDNCASDCNSSGGDGGDTDGDGVIDDEEKPIKVDPLEDSEIQAACDFACDGVTEDCPCFSCIKEPGNVWTEIGCIRGTAYGATISVMRIAIGIITGLVLLRFIQAGILYGSGDPEKLKEASSIAIAAAAALIFLGLCVVLINFAGINILGFGKEIKLITG